MAIPLVPIGVMLGKADSAFKMVGGSSIIFNALRSRIFGKVLRAIEYPDGDLRTVKIRAMSVYRLQALIAAAQPPPFPTAFLEPEDVKQISLFTSPHFTEPVTIDSDVSALPDNAWLFWSKDSYKENPLPVRGVKLDGSHIKKLESKSKVSTIKDEELQDASISLAQRIRAKSFVNRWQYDRIVDLAVDRDAGLLTIARNFRDDETEFRLHALRLLERRDPQSILLSAAEELTDEEADGEGEGPAAGRSLEPQVELAGRE